ncbi:MAG: M20/M25/M40 family metallo-hydrolase [Intestinibacillus sp.]
MEISRERLVQTFTELVAIDSPSFGERRMADHLKAQLAALGIPCEEDDTGGRIGGSAGNLYARLDGDESLAPLLFCAHMDTVEPSSGKRAVLGGDGRIESAGNTVLGADDCAGIAAILEALRAIREQRLPCRPIEVLFTVAEEVYCRGAAQFDFSRIRAREAYVLDLSAPMGTAACQAPTILSFTAIVHGKASHAGFAPDHGVHAIRAAADAVAKLPHGRIGEDTTLNVGVIGGGLAANIIPDTCTLEGEIRSFVHGKALALAGTVRQQVETSAAALGGTVTFSSRVNVQAYETPPEHPVMARYARACGAQGLPFVPTRTFGGSDNNVFAQHGIAGAVVASAMHACHSDREYTTVDELVSAAALTLRLMTDRG